MKTNLAYHISLPSGVEAGKTYPVIYTMHGRGSNEEDIISLLQELKEEFIIIGIRGPLVLHDGYEYFTIKSIGNPNIDSFDQAIDRLRAFIDEVQKKYPIDSSRQFLFGFSQGAILSMSLALSMGDQIKGIVALNGYIPKHVKESDAVKSVENLRIFIAHGSSDPIFPLQIGNDNYEYFKERNDQVEYRVYPVGHGITVEEKNDFIKWFKISLLGNALSAGL